MSAIAQRLSGLRSKPRLILSSANLLAQGFSLIGGLIVARLLGTEGRGLVATVSVYDEASSKGLGLGIPAAVGHSAATVTEESAVREAEGVLLGAAIRIALLTAPLAAAIAYLVDRYALGDTPGAIRLIVVIAITATPFLNSIPQTCRMILVARGELRLLAPVTLAPPIMRLVTFSVLAVVDEFTSTTAAAAVLISSWLGSGVAWRLASVRPIRGGRIAPLLTYGVRTIPASLASLTNSRLDQLLMVPLLSTEQLGIYAAAVGVAFIPVNIGSALALSIYRDAARDTANRAVTNARFRQAAIAVTAAGIVSAIGAWALIVPVYGQPFAGSVTPAVLLIVGSIFMGLSLVVVQIANACGAPGLGSISSVTALAVTIGGLIIALPRYGVVGAATVSLAAYFANFVVAFALARSKGFVGRAKIGTTLG